MVILKRLVAVIWVQEVATMKIKRGNWMRTLFVVIVMLLSMMFMVIFATFAVGMLAMSSTNAQVAVNHH